MGTSAAPMASTAKSVTAHSQRFSLMSAMRSPFFAPNLQERGSQRADALIHLIGGERMPLVELVLPKNGARIGGRGDAKEKIVDRRDRGNGVIVLIVGDGDILTSRTLVSVSKPAHYRARRN